MKLEWFFDYACPYCFRGHKILLEFIPHYPDIQMEWRPCEAHPRPDPYGPHSDLCARGMFFARDRGVDLLEYHHRIYRAIWTERLEIEDLHVIAQAVKDILDPDAFYTTLSQGTYLDNLAENNRLAWEVHEFPAVPSLCVGRQKLVSIEDVGITKSQLKAFLDSVS